LSKFIPVQKFSRSVLVVEDDLLLSSLISEELTERGFRVATASDAAAARKQVDKFDPDLILLDLALGDGPSGVHLAHALHRDRPDIAILVLTKYSDVKSLSLQALELPESVGFLRKQLVADPKQLLEAIEQVLSDRASQVRQDKGQKSPVAKLSARSRLVLSLLAEGFSNQEIARQTGLGIKSVERLIAQIYLALEIDTSPSKNPRVAAALAYLKGIGATDGN
jgi:DNA-binding NarL/FixJ family response regulator